MGAPTARLGGWLQVRTKPTFWWVAVGVGFDRSRVLIASASSVRDCPAF